MTIPDDNEHVDKRDSLPVTGTKPRRGWAAAAEQMHQAGEDELLIPDVFEDENSVES